MHGQVGSYEEWREIKRSDTTAVLNARLLTSEEQRGKSLRWLVGWRRLRRIHVVLLVGRTYRPSTAGMEARIQRRTLPAVGCAGLFSVLFVLRCVTIVSTTASEQKQSVRLRVFRILESRHKYAPAPILEICSASAHPIHNNELPPRRIPKQPLSSNPILHWSPAAWKHDNGSGTHRNQNFGTDRPTKCSVALSQVAMRI